MQCNLGYSSGTSPEAEAVPTGFLKENLFLLKILMG